MSEQPAPLIRDRGTEEPLGRWEDRCEFLYEFGNDRVMVCDRKVGHRGRHQGRLIFTGTISTRPKVLGWWKPR